MRRTINSFLLVTLLAASPALVFASGSETAQPQVSSYGNPGADQAYFRTRTRSQAPARTIATEPYNLGKAVFAGKYNLGRPKLSPLNIEEKRQRLAALQKSLPSAEKKNLAPAALSHRLTNREANALEYFLRMRFKKYLDNAPTWAQTEPPPKATASR